LNKRLSLLAAEGAALSQAGDTSGGLGKNVGAAGAHDDGLGVREDGGDLDASRALDVHEVGVGRLYESLQLVGLLLKSVGRVHSIQDVGC